jgi:hypothetical protein
LTILVGRAELLDIAWPHVGIDQNTWFVEYGKARVLDGAGGFDALTDGTGGFATVKGTRNLPILLLYSLAEQRLITVSAQLS